MTRLLAILASLMLAACASVPRGPASTLADAGIKTSNAIGTDARNLSGQLLEGESQTAFSGTWDTCQSNVPGVCQPQIPSSASSDARRKVTEAILFRAKAIDALGGAYQALELEAEYDARSDLVGSVAQLVDSVNTYTPAVASLPGATATALIAQPLVAAIKLGTGIWADQKQKARLQAANASIAAATERLRDALKIEAAVFDSLAQAVVDERVAAQIALLDSKLVSGGEMIRPMTTRLGLTLAKDADATLAKSDGARAAVAAAYKSSRQAEVHSLHGRYQASIVALEALLVLHKDFAAERAMSLSDVTRAISELDAALAEAKTE